MQLTATDVTKVIKGKTVLSHINLSLNSGYVYGFVGPNASGKTMLFRALSGLMSVTAGVVSLDGKILKKDFPVLPNLGILLENVLLYLNLLTVYPDQPYDQPEIIHPISGCTIVKPEDMADFQTVLPKEEKVLEIVRAKIAAGERVMIYTSWTRTDTQRKLLGLLREEGIRTEILSTQIVPEKREDWLSKRLSAGTQVIITNPKCVETGLDLNAFTTLIFYSMGYNLFTLRQASRRSWRINQTAPRVEVYMLYYADTMQAKAMKLMASKLAVAGLIEGTFSEEGLAAMSDVQDMTSQMAKELMLGIKDNVEDIAVTFKKMAIINPHRAVKQLPEPVTVQKERVVEVPQPESVRAADTAARQTLYDGLLQASRTGRKPKHTELEDQLSMFDTAA